MDRNRETEPLTAQDTTGAGIDAAILEGAPAPTADVAAAPRVAAQELRSFDRYREDEDDGSMNAQEHERRSHALAQSCTDCAPDAIDQAQTP